VLPSYRGTYVHDGWFASTHYMRCWHALCDVHLLHEITCFEELSAETEAWASPLKELPLEMKKRS
jgi:transposase